MDVLLFMKEEYSAIRAELPGLAPGDLAEALVGAPLRRFMVRLELLVRVGGDLILPEVMDAGRSASAAALVAEDQLKGLGRIVAAFRKTGALADAKRADVFRKVSAHVDQMERAVLPLVRELLPTAVREDIGEIALDYRSDFEAGSGKVKASTSASNASGRKSPATISA